MSYLITHAILILTCAKVRQVRKRRGLSLLLGAAAHLHVTGRGPARLHLQSFAHNILLQPPSLEDPSIVIRMPDFRNYTYIQTQMH